MVMENNDIKNTTSDPSSEQLEEITLDVPKEDKKELLEEMESLDINTDSSKLSNTLGSDGVGHNTDVLESSADEVKSDNNVEKVLQEAQVDSKKELLEEMESLDINTDSSKLSNTLGSDGVGHNTDVLESSADEEKSDNNVEKVLQEAQVDSKTQEERAKEEDMLREEKDPEPVFDGTEVPGMDVNRSISSSSLDTELATDGSAWPEKAAALKSFVKQKSTVAVNSVLRRLSGKNDDFAEHLPGDECKEGSHSPKDSEAEVVPPVTTEMSVWNPLNYIKMKRDADTERKIDQEEDAVEASLQTIVTKGRVMLYTKIGCQESREARLFLHRKRLRYVEINIDVYPSRKIELENFTGSSDVPKIFFNDVVIGGVSELKALDECGKLAEKIDILVTEAPPVNAPLPPLSGEDDVSSSAAVDELAVVVRNMKQAILVKDRFYKMRIVSKCFLGSDAVEFLLKDQMLEREEAVEFARKLASELFFQHVLDENLFEDGKHLYRFLDDDPVVLSQCHNIPMGIIAVKPKPITEIASRLRFLSNAIFEAYTSEDGRHVDYRSIHGSEEFARYLRIVQELHRVELQDMPREETLAFFINLYNMMAIHAILVWGHPTGPLERRKMFGDFKYIIGGCTYSLSAIENGILRGNQRPPYTLMKPFGAKDKRSKVALPYPEPLTHFALVCGTRSGPAIRCYSPGNVDKELIEAAQNFLRAGGFNVDFVAKVAYISKILKWFRVDFGNNEVEVLKHASKYLEATYSEAMLELLANNQLKVIYQPYDWEINN